MNRPVQTLVVCLVTLLFAATHVTAQEDSAALRKQAQEAELEIGRLRFRVPDTGDATAAEIKDFIDERAKAAELTVDVKLTPPVAQPFSDGAPSPIVLYRADIRGRAPYMRVERLMRRLARTATLAIAGFDHVDITAVDHDQVDFDIAYIRAAWDNANLPKTAPRSGTAASTADPIADAYRRRRDFLQATLQIAKTVEERYAPQPIADILTDLNSGAMADLNVALISFHADRVISVDAVTLGKSQAALDDALPKSRLTKIDEKTSDEGACRAFHLTATPTDAQASNATVIANGSFDGTARSICHMTEVAPAKVVSVPAAPAGSKRIVLRARDLDVVDVFHILNDTTGMNFIIDPDVTGRISLDANSSPEQIISAVRSAAGVTVDEGPIRRVRKSGRASRPREQKWEGQVISMQVKSAALPDILCALKEPMGIESFLPFGADSTTSVYATDVPWDQLVSWIIDATGFTYEIKEGRVTLRREGLTGKPAQACLALPYSRTWWRVSPNEFRSAQLPIAALAAVEDQWTAYVYTPGKTRRLAPVLADDTFVDGRVTAINVNGMSIQGEGGSKTVPLR